MKRPPRPGETIVTRLRIGKYVTVPVVKHSGPWIMFGLRVPYLERSDSDHREQARKKPRLVSAPHWRVHRFDEGRTWIRSTDTVEVRAILVADALR